MNPTPSTVVSSPQPPVEPLEGRLFLSAAHLAATHSLRADFNEDGIRDWVSTVRGGGLKIALGRAGGGYGRPTAIWEGGFARGGVIAASDVDGDGHLDLIVYGSGTVKASVQPAVTQHHARLKALDTTFNTTGSTSFGFNSTGFGGTTGLFGSPLGTTGSTGTMFDPVGSTSFRSGFTGTGTFTGSDGLGFTGLGTASGSDLLGLGAGSTFSNQPGDVFTGTQLPSANQGIVAFPNRGSGPGTDNALFGSGAGSFGGNNGVNGNLGPVLTTAVPPAIIPGGAFVLLGDGDGTFEAPVAIGGSKLLRGGAGSRIIVTDVNNDGFNDVVLARRNGVNVQVLYGSQTGVFANARNITWPV